MIWKIIGAGGAPDVEIHFTRLKNKQFSCLDRYDAKYMMVNDAQKLVCRVFWFGLLLRGRS